MEDQTAGGLEIQEIEGREMKSKKSIKYFLVLLFVLGIVSAQPDTLWSKRFGGGDLDAGSCIQQTTDGGFIITGYTYSYGEGLADVWLIKTDDSGDTLWTKTFGGDQDDRANFVQQTTDGGYILVGYTRSSGAGIFDVWLIKTDDTGEMEWSKTYGGFESDIGVAVQQTSDGGYAILANSDSYGAGGAGMFNIWLIRTDSLGDTLWTKTYGDTLRQGGKSFQLTSDGGYIIVGHTTDWDIGHVERPVYLAMDIWLVRTDASGDTLWTRTFGGESDEEGLAVMETSNGSYVLAGYTYESGWSDLILIKTDDLGYALWETVIHGEGSEFPHSLQETIDGGYFVFGHTNSWGPGQPADNIWLLKFDDTAGDTLWSKVIGGWGDDRALFGQQTSDGGYIITGYTVPSGTFFWDLWLIRFAPEIFSRQLAMIESSRGSPSSYHLHQNYPNPFNPVTTVKYDLPDQSQVNITVYDIMGRHIKTLVNGNQDPGIKSILWDATDEVGRPINSGVYLYRIKTGDFEQTRRMMLVK